MYKKLLQDLLGILLIALTAIAASAQSPPPESKALKIDTALPASFRFVAYGDTRFTDPANTDAADPEVRKELVRAIAEAHPAFVSFGGDITYVGSNDSDWTVYNLETKIWQDSKIRVYPALGNHDLKDNKDKALNNYFAHFPFLQQNRFYAVQTAKTLMLTLDSSQDETTGPQGEWLKDQLAHLAADIDFVFLVLHHPPYTCASDDPHRVRHSEKALAEYLEKQQENLRTRIVVFAGHVHNYERHEHGNITYFVSGGGAAKPHKLDRTADDKFQNKGVNYHYLLVEVEAGKLKVTMNRLEMKHGKPIWTTPDIKVISVPAALAP